MQAFRFQLATVLRIRETQLRREEAVLEKLHAERRRLELALAAEEQAVEASWQARLAQSTLGSADVVGLEWMREGLKRSRAVYKTKMAAQDAAIAKQLAVVIEARRKVKLLDQLRAQRFAQWKAEADRELMALVDDVTNAKEARMRREQWGVVEG